MVFWILAALISLGSACLMILPMFRSAGKEEVDSDIAVYKDQLAEIDRDLARGVLDKAEAETSRAEVGRRLLAASDRSSSSDKAAPRSATTIATLGIVALSVVGGGLLYQQIGAPGAPDRPLAARDFRAERPSQEQFEAQMAELNEQDAIVPEGREAELIDQLRQALKDRTDDVVGHQLLANTLSTLRQFPEAWRAQQKVVDLKGSTVAAADYTTQAELMVFAARGYVSPEAEDVLREALLRDPSDRRARFYSGAAMAQNGQPQAAMDLWTGLLKEDDPDAPWKEPVREQIRQLAANEGLPLPPSMQRGPDAAAVEAAQDMNAEDRNEMIRGMVEGLAERLATEGGTPDEWARLISALGVLGEVERARTIAEEARGVFAGKDAALAAIEAAAASLPE